MQARRLTTHTKDACGSLAWHPAAMPILTRTRNHDSMHKSLSNSGSTPSATSPSMPTAQPLPQAQVHPQRRRGGACWPTRSGVDFFGVGEHHREDFAVSAPEVVLAAIAGRTKRIRLGSAVTVLSSDDPVRVFQRFATLDAVSNGRAEVILGRGSFTESFPLFGYDLDALRGAVRGEARPVRRAARSRSR